MAELWVIYDEEGNPTDKIMDKSDPGVWAKGIYHYGADVWIMNKENKLLIQKRSPQKRLEPNVWSMTGGSVIYGEKPIETIVRESKEELGIDVNPDYLKFLIKFKTGNVWVEEYILRQEFDISKLKFLEEEVSDAKWATWDEIESLENDGNFIKNRWPFVRNLIKKEIDL